MKFTVKSRKQTLNYISYKITVAIITAAITTTITIIMSSGLLCITVCNL